MKIDNNRVVSYKILAVAATFAVLDASAVQIQWADWQSSTPPTSSTLVYGQIVSGTTTIGLTYSNLQGIAFLQKGDSGDTDYWQQRLPGGGYGRVDATSPYTSSFVDNIPTGTDMVALTHDGSQTLTFSETVANPVFSYISLNGNGYAFDHDFEVLSYGHSGDGNDPGYWGDGTSHKEIVDIGGVLEYRLVGSGEPHGTIRFTGSFDSVTWRSLNAEYWNGFTVGIQGTAAQVFHTPDAGSSAILFSVSLAGLVAARRKLRS